MKQTIFFLQSAEDDLLELRSYLIKEFNQKAWFSSYQKIKKAIETLTLFPLRGAIVEELVSLGLNEYRQILVDMNRIIYEIKIISADIQYIYIHLICDVRKDLSSLLKKRLLAEPRKEYV